MTAPYNVPAPTYPAPSPGYQYEFTPGPYSAVHVKVPIPTHANPTQEVPPAAPLPQTDTGGPP